MLSESVGGYGLSATLRQYPRTRKYSTSRQIIVAGPAAGGLANFIGGLMFCRRRMLIFGRVGSAGGALDGAGRDRF
jgi:hypothetical protein